ncbi:MAG: DNA polymerase I, partial [Gemmatimonadales bacterium]
DALSRVLAELEFYSLASRLGLTADAEGAAELPEEATGPSVTLVDDPADLPDLIARLRAAPIVALSTEIDGNEPRGATLIGLSLAASPDEAWYLSFGHRQPVTLMDERAEVSNLPPLNDPACAPLAALLADPAVPKAGHDLKRDWQVLRHAGVELAGVAWDSMLASFVLDPGRRSHAIETLCLEHLGRAMRSRVDLVGRGRSVISFSEVAVAEAAPWCGSAAATVLALRNLFTPPLESQALAPLLANVELPLIEALTDMEWSGIRIDTALFARLSKEMGDDLSELEGRIVASAGGEFNLNSPRQLATLLFDELQLPVLKKTRTGPSTDADVLDQLAAMGHEIPALILQYRELQKLRSTYVDVLPLSINPETGRIHTVFNQTGAATGRLSSSDPNLQNIPVRTPRGEAIRLGFIPEEGWRFVVADYSQVELRLIAHLSGDPAFIEAFRRGGDIHRQTASVIFGVDVSDVTAEMRSRAKTINFATIYGQGPFALARQLGITQEEAKAFIARYFERFSGVRSYLDRMVDQAKRQGYVETIFGRRRYIPEIKDKNFNIRAFGERTATNSPVQGSAADLIKIAMRRIHDALKTGGFQGRMLLQVHDELVFEAPVPEVESLSILVKDHMQQAVALDVPLVVDVGVGENWLDAKH